MISARNARRKLDESIGSQYLLRIDRHPLHAGHVQGFVVGIGKKWALLAQTMDGGYFDGYVAFRVADVSRIRRDHTFESTFAQTQPEWPPSVPFDIDLDKTVNVISALAANAPLVGIQKEREREAIWIGVLYQSDRKRVWLHEVRPNASWHKRPLSYRLKAVTSVMTGDRYLTGLSSMAGSPPPVKLDKG
jgi:hypothetical protein